MDKEPWTEHGEQLPQIDLPNVNVPSSPHQAMPDCEMSDMLEDAFGFHDETALPHAPSDPVRGQDSGPTPDAQKFYKLLDDANTDLFPGATNK
ncbi:hypothetical protein M0R45_010247 [Rubus argutus]|uniref:Uncharacterized protein n=1 Tax=Rubus argutus TaxID=59490 RepID=A0AAW1Y6U2_RUBAR